MRSFIFTGDDSFILIFALPLGCGVAFMMIKKEIRDMGITGLIYNLFCLL